MTAVQAPSSINVERCCDILTAAFAGDPPSRWVWPDREVYFDAFPRFVRAFGGQAFDAGTAHTSPDGLGVALWLPPGSASDDAALAALFEQTVPPDRQGDLFALFERMASYHPAEPHWHLPLIGVAPSAQGRGIGTRLLRQTLSECDAAGGTAYLEATCPENVRLYARHGFVPVGRIDVAGCPTVTPMVRLPVE